jgi:uncharacterized protein YuzE
MKQPRFSEQSIRLAQELREAALRNLSPMRRDQIVVHEAKQKLEQDERAAGTLTNQMKDTAMEYSEKAKQLAVQVREQARKNIERLTKEKEDAEVPVSKLAVVTISIDNEAGAGYISLSKSPVASTKPLGGGVLVDLDAEGNVIGIEVLSLDINLPIERLVKEFNVPADALALLR